MVGLDVEYSMEVSMIAKRRSLRDHSINHSINHSLSLTHAARNGATRITQDDEDDDGGDGGDRVLGRGIGGADMGSAWSAWSVEHHDVHLHDHRRLHLQPDGPHCAVRHHDHDALEQPYEE